MPMSTCQVVFSTHREQRRTTENNGEQGISSSGASLLCKAAYTCYTFKNRMATSQEQLEQILSDCSAADVQEVLLRAFQRSSLTLRSLLVKSDVSEHLPLAFYGRSVPPVAMDTVARTLANCLAQPLPVESRPVTPGGSVQRGRRRCAWALLRSWVPSGATYLTTSVTVGSSRLRRATNSSCRTVFVGSLVELRSTDGLQDNWFGVVFRLYFPGACGPLMLYFLPCKNANSKSINFEFSFVAVPI